MTNEYKKFIFVWKIIPFQKHMACFFLFFFLFIQNFVTQKNYICNKSYYNANRKKSIIKIYQEPVENRMVLSSGTLCVK